MGQFKLYQKMICLSPLNCCTYVFWNEFPRWSTWRGGTSLLCATWMHHCCKGLQGEIKRDFQGDWNFLNVRLICAAVCWLDSVLNSTALCDEHSPKLECVESAALQASVPPQCAIYTHPNQPLHIPTNTHRHTHILSGPTYTCPELGRLVNSSLSNTGGRVRAVPRGDSVCSWHCWGGSNRWVQSGSGW